MSFHIDFYKDRDGTCPVEKFLDSMNSKIRVKILRMILLLEENGNELREPYSKYLADNIFELRIKLGTDIVRILYFFEAGERIVLINGFVKKTRKTPQKEIEKARKYRDRYLSEGKCRDE
ncbi:MAG: type II toxin-antitoxin system RelE/ParE family toxin [Hespellia sp.]|nr:type II toxin-antitoxin system RelE/ParE family toxin [Hespellia sp.]